MSLFYTDAKGVRLPVNFRAVDKAEVKTKNELFREMVAEVLAWGLAPAVVSAESWCSGVENLKFLRDQGLGFLVGLEKNRVVSAREHEYGRVEDTALPAAGRVLPLRGFGLVSVFWTVDKNNVARHYSASEPHQKSARKSPSPASRPSLPSTGAWSASTVPSKPVCHAERFFVRWKTAIANHLFCALRAFVHLETALWRDDLYRWYDLKRHLADQAVTNFIQQRTAKLGA